MNSMSAREVFNNARRMLGQAFSGSNINVSNFKLTQSFLRLEQALATGTTLFTFPVTNSQNNATPFNTEQRLNLQDSFVVSEMGIFVAKPASATDTAYELRTYANTVDFAVAGSATAANGTLLSNGKFVLSVNNDVLIPAWDLARHLYRPQTQLTGAATPPLDQKRLAEDGFYPVEPNIVMIGSKNNVPQISIPAALAAVETNERLIIVFRGILAQNSTPVS